MSEGREPPRRALFADERGTGMRVTWHAEADLVVLSLWHADACVGSFRLQPEQAARLAAFIVEHLGARAAGEGLTGEA
jgi:hypothetical protein